MNFLVYWAAKIAKIPDWKDENKKIQLTVGSLKKQLEEAHKKGEEYGREEERKNDNEFDRIMKALRLGREKNPFEDFEIK